MGDDTADWLSTRALEETLAEVAGRYDDWAQGYEDDVRSWGYTVPEDITALLVEHDPSGPLLDAGSGVGLVGRALVDGGIPADAIVGVDASVISLRRAAEAGWYRHLLAVDLNVGLPFDDDVFGGVVCGGVLSYIPDTAQVVYCIPLGYPRGNFGPVTRRPLEEVSSYDRWGQGG